MSQNYNNPDDLSQFSEESRLRGEAAQREAQDAAIARVGAELEAEAAQGEQQAVATLTVDNVGAHFNALPAWVELDHGDHDLYTRAQPVAVADRQAIRMLVAAGYVSEAKANEALQISHGWTEGALSAAPAAPDIAADLDFEPDEFHSIADMANVGYSLMQAIKSHRPEYCWNETPAEIVGDLLNERDEAMGKVPGGSAAPAPVGGDAVAATEEMARLVLEFMWTGAGHSMVNKYWPRDQVAKMQELLSAALAQDRAAQAGAAGVPEGWRLVPVMPTRAMAMAGWATGVKSNDTVAIIDLSGAYSAMLAAAPTPAAEGEVRNG